MEEEGGRNVSASPTRNAMIDERSSRRELLSPPPLETNDQAAAPWRLNVKEFTSFPQRRRFNHDSWFNFFRCRIRASWHHVVPFGTSRLFKSVLDGSDLEKETGERKKRESVLIRTVQYIFGRLGCIGGAPRRMLPSRHPSLFGHIVTPRA